MKAYIANIKINLKLTLRDKMILFFNYAFPLVFFFTFAQTFRAAQSGVITQIVSMVLILGVLGAGFFGAGLRTVQEREQNILRRFKVAPIGPAPILVASTVVGWLAYMPSAILILTLAHFVYGMRTPEQLPSLLLFLSLGVIAFRSLGLVIAAVVNSLQESQIIIQLLYLPMLFFSGATFPLAFLPEWVQIAAQFLPATYVHTGLQGILLRNETIAANAPSVVALILTTAISTFIATKLFRWEKGEKLPARAKLWLLIVFAPFLLLGGWQAYSRENIAKVKLLQRELQRSQTFLIRNVRIFTGSKVIPSGSLLLRHGKIERIWNGDAPESAREKAELIDGSGKTVLPGLIDTHTHLSAPGGILSDWKNYQPEKAMERALAAYLYSGVTALRSAGDPVQAVFQLRGKSRSGEKTLSELFVCGPVFTAEGGHGTEYFQSLPEAYRSKAMQQFARLPKTGEEARTQVRELKAAGVDAIKAVLDSGSAGSLFSRMDTTILKAIIEEAHRLKLPVVVHTGDSRDVKDAVELGADGIEHGSARDVIPNALFQQMAVKKTTYDPTLAVADAARQLADGKTDVLDRSLVQQVGPAPLLRSTRDYLLDPKRRAESEKSGHYPMDLKIAMENLRRAWKAGVPLVAGSDSGNPLVFHGPSIHREMALWVEAGIPAEAALHAATVEAARRLGAGDRIGSIEEGREATLLLVDGDPLKDISSTERISGLFFKGERVGRSGLFEEYDK
jgi:Imidazolonepropionase and related amidohydrolases